MVICADAFQASFEQEPYYGRGPVENYNDRKFSQRVGIYQQTADDQFYPYIRPQETGTKGDMRWWEQTDKEGNGFCIYGDQPFYASALHYNQEDLDDGDEKEQRHSTDVPQSKFTNLFIDLEHAGVGGEQLERRRSGAASISCEVRRQGLWLHHLPPAKIKPRNEKNPCAFGLALCSLSVTAGDIYVDKNGSVADALKQAREWRRLNSQEIAGGIRIHLADAVYPLQSRFSSGRRIVAQRILPPSSWAVRYLEVSL